MEFFKSLGFGFGNDGATISVNPGDLSGLSLSDLDPRNIDVGDGWDWLWGTAKEELGDASIEVDLSDFRDNTPDKVVLGAETDPETGETRATVTAIRNIDPMVLAAGAVIVVLLLKR